MLDTDTKRRIDTARDILVGKVPDPKSQVEQITIALIYKFMDDMDAESEEFGGKRKFFAKEFGRYGWAKLMRSGLGGHETLNLYTEAIAKMPENPGIPPLFRDIFKNAYLPYRDPETLKMFLKIIDEFTYDHSERLGDAFEYLLSVLGSQGDAGQFRTPRHIIDFMVEVLDPKKTETVLDPACGTAGFLISAWKHILKANADKKGNSTLTPDDKGRLALNFKGYDISPDMVRLSLVNLYLHGFADPHIAEYDTLTSQDRWSEHADVILANPPFMSPKGGIKPHNRFSVQSKRSEVLFVDYMAEHLTPTGRAGIIVPEGIIFQSQTAYKQLRKMLVEEYLVAVVSLPAGVFNPYSGVKTSILILDKSLAKKTNTIAFFKVENDGFGLGAQRREIGKNDLPQAKADIDEYLRRLRAGAAVADFQPTLGLIVEKEKIAANGDYNLSGERYQTALTSQSHFPMVPLGEVAELLRGITFGKSDQLEQANEDSLLVATTKAAQASGIVEDDLYHIPRALLKDETKLLRAGDILISTANSLNLLGRTTHVRRAEQPMSFGAFMSVIRSSGRILDGYLIHCLRTAYAADFFVRNANTTTNISNLNLSTLAGFQIPLPPLEVQKEIVAEIEGYQKVINGARAVLDNYRPTINLKARAIDVKARVLAALCKFRRRDAHLLQVRGNERSITAKIACYLQEQFQSWDVDNEYNREGMDPKRAIEGALIIPDIIVHQRGTNRNYIVIETKKQKRSESDCKKLLDLSKKQGYQYAISLTLDLALDPEQWLEIVVEPKATAIKASEDWPMVTLGEVIEGKPKNGYSGRPVDRPTNLKVLSLSATTMGTMDLSKSKFLDEDIPLDAQCRCRPGDIYLQRGNTKELVGTAAIFDVDEPNYVYPDLMIRVRADEAKIESNYLLAVLQSAQVREYVTRNAVGAAGSMPKINQTIVESIPIPLPPLPTQQAIVAEIEAEQALVAANRELIARLEKKVQATLAHVWGADETPSTGA